MYMTDEEMDEQGRALDAQREQVDEHGQCLHREVSRKQVSDTQVIDVCDRCERRLGEPYAC